MTQLYLNDIEVTISPTSSIKLTTENPYFTKASSYTMEIELPSDIPANRRVFGWIDRIDVDKHAQTYHARLIVDGRPAIIGLATVTSVTESSVRVQLLGEVSAYNYRNKFEDLYIDELEMADFRQYFFDAGASNILEMVGGIFNDITTVTDTVYGNRYPFVCYPIRNSTSGYVMNGLTICDTGGDVKFVGCCEYEKNPDFSSWYSVSRIAFQPYIWYICHEIAKATGFDLKNEDNALYGHRLFGRIFMANANPYTKLSLLLPHWTVNQWWTAIEDTFGVVIAIDYTNRRMRIVTRKDYYATSDITYLCNVADEVITAIGDESKSDISTSNVGYADHDHDPADILTDYIKSNASQMSGFADIGELITWQQTNAPATDTIYNCDDGRRYIYRNNDGGQGFIEVDMLRPRIVKATDTIDISLKFVPAHFAETDLHVFRIGTNDVGWMSISNDVYAGDVTARILEAPGADTLATYRVNEIGIGSIYDLITGEEEEESAADTTSQDVIYMAIANADHPDRLHVNDGSVGIPRAYVRERTVCDLDVIDVRCDAPYSLSLNPTEGQINLASETLTGEEIDTNVKHTIKFISSTIPRADSIFVIRGRRMVAEKIEADIAVTGLNKLLTGYFYNLD